MGCACPPCARRQVLGCVPPCCVTCGQDLLLTGSRTGLMRGGSRVPDGLVDLPTDLLAAVLAQLDARDVGRSAQTARSLQTPHTAPRAPPHRQSRSRASIPARASRRPPRWCAGCRERSRVASDHRGGRVGSARRSTTARFVWGGYCPGWDHDDDAPAVGFLGLGELDDIEAAGDTGLAIVTRPRRVDLWKETAVAEVRGLDPQRRSRPTRRRVVLGVEYTVTRPARTSAPGCRRSAPQRARRRRRWRRRRHDVVRADGGGAPCPGRRRSRSA